MIGQGCKWVKFFDSSGDEAFGPGGLDLPTLQQSQAVPKSEIPQYLIDEVALDNKFEFSTILMTDYFRRPSGEILVVAQSYTEDASTLVWVSAYSLQCYTPAEVPEGHPPSPTPIIPIPDDQIATAKVIDKKMLGIVTGLIAAAIGYYLYVR